MPVWRHTGKSEGSTAVESSGGKREGVQGAGKGPQCWAARLGDFTHYSCHEGCYHRWSALEWNPALVGGLGRKGTSKGGGKTAHGKLHPTPPRGNKIGRSLQDCLHSWREGYKRTGQFGGGEEKYDQGGTSPILSLSQGGGERKGAGTTRRDLKGQVKVVLSTGRVLWLVRSIDAPRKRRGTTPGGGESKQHV